jgi:hypothetical protein
VDATILGVLSATRKLSRTGFEEMSNYGIQPPQHFLEADFGPGIAFG